MGGTPCGYGVGGVLVCESCKQVDVSPCGLGVGGWWTQGPLVCESCKLVDASPCGLGVGSGGFITV